MLLLPLSPLLLLLLISPHPRLTNNTPYLPSLQPPHDAIATVIIVIIIMPTRPQSTPSSSGSTRSWPRTAATSAETDGAQITTARRRETVTAIGTGTGNGTENETETGTMRDAVHPGPVPVTVVAVVDGNRVSIHGIHHPQNQIGNSNNNKNKPLKMKQKKAK